MENWVQINSRAGTFIRTPRVVFLTIHGVGASLISVTWFMLQIVTAGKYTSDNGAVVVSTVVTTVDLVNSEVCLKTKQNAMITELRVIPIHINLQPFCELW